MTRTATPARIVYNQTGFLFVVGDAERVDARRSSAVEDDHAWLLPLKRFVWDHGLVLACSETIEAEEEQSTHEVYVRPKVRLDDSQLPEMRRWESFGDDEVQEITEWAKGVLCEPRHTPTL
jgi:hypothetical protein